MPSQIVPGALAGAAEASAPARLRLRQWRPMPRNSLRGFASVTLPIGLEIDDVAVHVAGSRAWVSLPGGRCWIPDGRALRDHAGKTRHALPVRWSTRAADLDRKITRAFDDGMRRPREARRA